MKHWSLWLAQFSRGKAGLAFQTAFYLLATAGLIFALMTLVACDCNDNGIDDCDVAGEARYEAIMKSIHDTLSPQEKPPATPKIQSTSLGRTGVLTGTRVLHGLLLDSFDFTTPITYTWYPPAAGRRHKRRSLADRTSPRSRRCSPARCGRRRAARRTPAHG